MRRHKNRGSGDENDRQLARLLAHALLTIVTKESWILERIRIRVDGVEFDLNTLRVDVEFF